MYMFEVFGLVTGAVFSTIFAILAVTTILKLAVDAAQDYARARRVIERITPPIDLNVVNLNRSE